MSKDCYDPDAVYAEKHSVLVRVHVSTSKNYYKLQQYLIISLFSSGVNDCLTSSISASLYLCLSSNLLTTDE